MDVLEYRGLACGLDWQHVCPVLGAILVYVHRPPATQRVCLAHQKACQCYVDSIYLPWPGGWISILAPRVAANVLGFIDYNRILSCMIRQMSFRSSRFPSDDPAGAPRWTPSSSSS
jgi:hypothetical protein